MSEIKLSRIKSGFTIRTQINIGKEIRPGSHFFRGQVEVLRFGEVLSKKMLVIVGDESHATPKIEDAENEAFESAKALWELRSASADLACCIA